MTHRYQTQRYYCGPISSWLTVIRHSTIIAVQSKWRIIIIAAGLASPYLLVLQYAQLVPLRRRVQGMTQLWALLANNAATCARRVQTRALMHPRSAGFVGCGCETRMTVPAAGSVSESNCAQTAEGLTMRHTIGKCWSKKILKACMNEWMKYFIWVTRELPGLIRPMSPYKETGIKLASSYISYTNVFQLFYTVIICTIGCT